MASCLALIFSCFQAKALGIISAWSIIARQVAFFCWFVGCLVNLAPFRGLLLNNKTFAERTFVIPAKAPNPDYAYWIPAFAGMTSGIFCFRNRN
ncbi:MAG: hypothetical protein DRP66_06095 [Planctomycetota bacterium]|nr:MAG: hypothetical protein DRP66_06095 [Planctomycetota bacterium]